MRKPLLIGNNVFLTKKEALGYYKVILNSYNFGESLSGKDYEEVFGLIEYGESFEEEEFGDTDNDVENENMRLQNKEGLEDDVEENVFIEDIKVSKVQFNTRCFEIFLSDASSRVSDQIDQRRWISEPSFRFANFFKSTVICVLLNCYLVFFFRVV